MEKRSKDPLVSIVVPVYNVERFLGRCIKSIQDQTYDHLEIILVDDGSTDGSKVICDQMARSDTRIKVIHKKNEGLSAARNDGYELSTGEYISFVDSDDYIAKEYVKKSLSLCQSSQAEISIMHMAFIDEEENKEIVVGSTGEILILNAQDAIENSLYQTKYSCCAPGKFYKKSVIGDIRFPEKRLSEDLAVMHLILSAANKIIYSSEIGYYYRQRNDSIMHGFSERRLDVLDWTSNIQKFVQERYPTILPAAICRNFNAAIHLLLNMPDKGQLHDVCYERVWTVIRKTRNIVIFDKKARSRERVAALLSYGGEHFLKSVWRSKFAVKQKVRKNVS